MIPVNKRCAPPLTIPSRPAAGISITPCSAPMNRLALRLVASSTVYPALAPFFVRVPHSYRVRSTQSRSREYRRSRVENGISLRRRLSPLYSVAPRATPSYSPDGRIYHTRKARISLPQGNITPPKAVYHGGGTVALYPVAPRLIFHSSFFIAAPPHLSHTIAPS